MGSKAKGWLLIACACILAGVLLYGGLLFRHSWNVSAVFGTKLETVTEEIRGSFRDVTIRGDTEDIVFRPSEDGKCRVVFREHKNEKHTASVKDGTLLIEQENRGREWYERFTLFSFGKQEITVWLPKAEYGSLLVRESTGDVTIPKGITFADVDVTLGTGDADCRASCPGRIRISTSTGAIRLEDLSAGSLELSVSTGRTVVKDVSCTSFSSTGNTGSVTLEDVTVSGAMTIRRSTGGVRLDRCDAAELAIETSTGDVTGTLLTDKVFLAKSSTGRIRVPETVTGGRCSIKTGTGDIEISVP